MAETPNDWQAERTMTPVEFCFAISQLGMSQLAAGRYLGVSPRHTRRYARGDAKIDVGHALLLRSLIHHGERPLVPPRKPRRP